ncbi:MAG: hypothetical protein BGO76_02555 [Caedibacter sp. 38-128]|nr:MAG: hypothetical protein BGO76_02555 [Caedibacter sp. 38-128]
MFNSKQDYETLKFLYELGIDEVFEPSPTNKTRFPKRSTKLKEDHLAANNVKPGISQTTETKSNKEKIPLNLMPHAGSTKTLAAQAKTLHELRTIVENYNECSLKKTATNTVFSDGNPQARIMVIGEAPGADEDREGRPFVGLSGKLLDRMFAAIGLDRTTIYITNIIFWRPPGNRQPTSSETNLCLPFVERHIELVSPDFLVLVGGTSAKSILQSTEGIMKLRGKWLSYQTPAMTKPIKTLAIFHPAYLLRAPGQKRLAWSDLLMLKQAIDQA